MFSCRQIPNQNAGQSRRHNIQSKVGFADPGFLSHLKESSLRSNIGNDVAQRQSMVLSVEGDYLYEDCLTKYIVSLMVIDVEAS